MDGLGLGDAPSLSNPPAEKRSFRRCDVSTQHCSVLTNTTERAIHRPRGPLVSHRKVANSPGVSGTLRIYVSRAPVLTLGYALTEIAFRLRHTFAISIRSAHVPPKQPSLSRKVGTIDDVSRVGGLSASPMGHR